MLFVASPRRFFIPSPRKSSQPMSEEPTQINPEIPQTTRPAETDLQSVENSPAPTYPLPPAYQADPNEKPVWHILIAPAWFLLGILVGLAALTAYQRYLTPPPAPVAQTIDEATIKKAAREGLIEAIQSLQSPGAQGNSSQGPQAVDPSAFAVRDANVLGDKTAKVSIVEFADFQCPFCERHFQQVEPGIIQQYINTGKASLTYKHLAFLGPESVYAAVASECAADQGKFWDMHNYLFSHQSGENQGAFNKDKLIAFGKDIPSLDQTSFASCITSDATIARVQADTQEAQKFGVASTPTFFVNGKPLVGLTSPEEFKAAIEQALAQ